MFDDYKKEVLDCYLKKKNEGNLSLNLTHPTPGRLRDECINAYQLPYLNKYYQILFVKYSINEYIYTKIVRPIIISK